VRLLGVILATLAAVLALVAWFQSEGITGSGDLSLPSREFHVVGAGNTLASLARLIGDPARFSYDPGTRTAVSRVTLIIEGELQLGVPGDPASGEYLEMATEVCGDLRIEVRPGGVLQLDYSTIRTVSQVLSNTACSRGYAMFVDGSLLMDHARISYLSGSTSQCLRKSARATIRNSAFAYCDGSALSCLNVDGSRITIEKSELTCGGNWALIVQGSGGSPLVVRDTVFEAQLGDVLLTGESAEVQLIDCVFDPAKIVFNRETGRLTVQWTRRFKVVDAAGGQPVSDALVLAKPIGDDSHAAIVEARTSGAGIASLVLTDRLILPGPRGQNAGPPVLYEVRAAGPAGKGEARLVELTVRGKEAPDAEPTVLELR
jgi:hypothetical protein